MKSFLYGIACSLFAGTAGMLTGSVTVEEVLAVYTDQVVIRTYESMASEAIRLSQAVDHLVASPSDQGVITATQFWLKTRAYWEQSEAFLFGPAAFNHLDPKLDSWPLDQEQLDHVLGNIDAGRLVVDDAYVRDYLGAALRGFHAIEYLLFREGQPRRSADLAAGEKAYLKSATRVLMEDAITLEAWWAGIEHISQEKLAILEAAEIEVGKAFGEEFRRAGKPGSRYASPQEALEEILQGCVDIADEVAAEKIGGPAETKNPRDCESWYSWTSLEDFQNNILGIRLAYTADGEKSVASLVAAKNPQLNAAVLASITQALANVKALPSPYSKHLHEEEKIAEAIAACVKMSELLAEAGSLLAE